MSDVSIVTQMIKFCPSQCLESAHVSFIPEEILKEGLVLLSDHAGQFAVFNHAACWIHMERPLRKVLSSSELVTEVFSLNLLGKNAIAFLLTQK